jgi:hypothetical protein
MTSNTRTVVLICGNRKRTYPVPPNVELHDFYTIDGLRWTVTAVLTTEDVPLAPMVSQ